MKRRSSFCLFAVLLAFTALAAAQRPRDPLTDEESDQLREAAQDPQARLKLYVKFTEARVQAIDLARTDPKVAAADRGQRIHDLLQDVATLADEISDNIDDYDQRGLDLRKALPPLLRAVPSWQLRLQALKSADEQDQQAAREARDYYFALDTAIDALKDLADDAHETLAEQQAKNNKKH